MSHRSTQFSETDIQAFLKVREVAIDQVCKRFYEIYPDLLPTFGARGVEATREDIGYTLDFLRPALEFGYIKPFVDYLFWLTEVLTTRGVSAQHVLTMLDWLAECFETEMGNEQGATIAALLRSAKADVISKQRVASGIDEHMPEAWPEYVDLEKALLKGDLRSAKEIFDKRTAEGNSLLELELHLVQPALYQVGRDWQQNKVTVAQEHLATSTAITLMAQEFTRTKRGVPNGKKVICACVKGNNHAVGIRIVADAFELNGWEVLFLGKDVSSQDLIERTRAFEPHLICLSVSIAEHLQIAKSTIKSLHMTFAEKVPAIMLGGLAVNAHTPLAQVVGADLFAPDAKKALEESK